MPSDMPPRVETPEERRARWAAQGQSLPQTPTIKALPHSADESETVEPEKVRFMRRDGWWLVPLVILAVSAIPIGMALSGNGETVVDLLVWLVRVTAVLLVPGSVAGIVVSLIRKKPRWALIWAIVLVVALIGVALLYFLQ